MKTVVITGASSGVGRAACYAFLKKGYKVIGLSRDQRKIEKLLFL